MIYTVLLCFSGIMKYWVPVFVREHTIFKYDSAIGQIKLRQWSFGSEKSSSKIICSKHYTFQNL